MTEPGNDHVTLEMRLALLLKTLEKAVEDLQQIVDEEKSGTAGPGTFGTETGAFYDPSERR